MSVLFFQKKKNPVVLTTIYVETTVNVFGSENTPIKNCCNNSFFMQIFSFFKKNRVVLSTIYVKTTGNVFVSENPAIKNC